jgi:hypothetical protein
MEPVPAFSAGMECLHADKVGSSHLQHPIRVIEQHVGNGMPEGQAAPLVAGQRFCVYGPAHGSSVGSDRQLPQ